MNKKSTETCPECDLFVWACRCKEPIEKRIPTSREIHNYIDCKIPGLVELIPNESWVSGFKAGWATYKDHLPDFLKKQTVVDETIKDGKKQ